MAAEKTCPDSYCGSRRAVPPVTKSLLQELPTAPLSNEGIKKGAALSDDPFLLLGRNRGSSRDLLDERHTRRRLPGFTDCANHVQSRLEVGRIQAEDVRLPSVERAAVQLLHASSKKIENADLHHL